MSEVDGFNESHRRRLLANAQRADELLSDVEDILSAAESRSPFPKYQPDVSPHQARLIRSHTSRFRDHLSRVLTAIGIETDVARFGSLHSIRVTLNFVRIAIQEMAPEYLRGYGDLSKAAESELRGLCAELEGLIDSLERDLALGPGLDLQARLERLQQTAKEGDLLRLLDRIINEGELAEFRAGVLHLVERLETRRFEIAVFGRVSSGKSSLLNHVLETNVLPVGVNPITAVPTRIVFGPEPSLTVTLADRSVRRCPVTDLPDYASEERNPGNGLAVTRLVVTIASPRLEDGLVLVDTPGLGALSTAGAAETLSYLPQCDLGIVLISAVNPINEEDLNTIYALSHAGIPVIGLLSKADLLSTNDRRKALDYAQKQIIAKLGLRIEVYPVSTVGSDEELLHSWFTGRLAPLMGRHRELARNSIRRKAGAMRESVIAALRLKLGAEATGGPACAISPNEVERGLRTVAGNIEAARHFCFGALDDIRSLHEIVLNRCVEAAIERWKEQPSGPHSDSAIIGETAEGLGEDAASQISQRLTELAQQLDSALVLAAQALRDRPSAPEELADCVREMPRFESPVGEIDLSPPRFHSLLPGFARSLIKSRLRRTVSSGLQAGFSNYARTMEVWVRRVLADIQRRFDSRADAYRAQLARMIDRRTLSPEQQAQAERDLAELESLAAADALD